MNKEFMFLGMGIMLGAFIPLTTKLRHSIMVFIGGLVMIGGLFLE